MPRVKRGSHRRDYRHKTLSRAKGYFLTKSKLNRAAQEAVEKALRYGYVGPPSQEAQLPLPVDRADQRSLPGS